MTALTSNSRKQPSREEWCVYRVKQAFLVSVLHHSHGRKEQEQEWQNCNEALFPPIHIFSEWDNDNYFCFTKIRITAVFFYSKCIIIITIIIFLQQKLL